MIWSMYNIQNDFKKRVKFIISGSFFSWNNIIRRSSTANTVILILSFCEAWTCPRQISGTTGQNFMKLGGVIDICFLTYHYVKFYVSIIIQLEVININVRNFKFPTGFYSNPHPLWTPKNMKLPDNFQMCEHLRPCRFHIICHRTLNLASSSYHQSILLFHWKVWVLNFSLH
jgi:hypothetical protein